MMELTPTQSQINRAKESAIKIGQLKNSITKGRHNTYGTLGEILFADFLGVDLCNTFDYDLIYNNKKIDVKTKCCTSKPRPHYFCSVTDFRKQNCDAYIFIRILKDFSKAWVLGEYDGDDFYKDGKFYRKGETDPNSPPNYRFKFTADCYNLPIFKLKRVYIENG